MTPRGLANARPGGGLGDTPSPPAWWHLYTPLAGRPAPRPGTRRPGLCAYGSLDSRKESCARPGGELEIPPDPLAGGTRITAGYAASPPAGGNAGGPADARGWPR